MRRIGLVVVALSGLLAFAGTAGAQVLRVGTYHGIAGQYSTIQAAVDAAKPGDWILVGPGDYKTTRAQSQAGRTNTPAGVLITRPRVYIRGMNRNTVIIDGTKPGSACCSAKASARTSVRSAARVTPYRAGRAPTA